MKAIVLTNKEREDIERQRRETPDKRIYMRLSAVLWVSDGRVRDKVAAQLGITARCLRKWLNLYRNRGLLALCTFDFRGDPGKLTPAQIESLKAEVAKGRFRSSKQIRAWIEEQFQVVYSLSGLKDLLYRIGVSFHQVSAFLWKGDRKKQRAFVKRVRRHRREMGRPGEPLDDSTTHFPPEFVFPEKRGKGHSPPGLEVGGRVRVTFGIFSGMEGEIKEILKESGVVGVALTIFGQAVEVKLEYDDVEQI